MSAGVFQALIKAFQLPLALKLREKSITLKSGERKERKKKNLTAISKDFHLNPPKAIGSAVCCKGESEENSGGAR